MDTYVETKEGFEVIYDKLNKDINIMKILYKGHLVAKNWMEIADFISILEAAIRNKLGTKNKYQIYEILVYGTLEEEYYVCIELERDLIYKFNIVETMQVVSKLNKILNVSNKLYGCKDY